MASSGKAWCEKALVERAVTRRLQSVQRQRWPPRRVCPSLRVRSLLHRMHRMTSAFSASALPIVPAHAPATRPVLCTVDEVLTPGCAGSRFVELRTARLVTAAGYRYVSGVGGTFLQHLHVVARLSLGVLSSPLLIADRARWIRAFFLETLAVIAAKTMVLDWQHLKQKCREMVSRIGHNHEAK